MKLSSKLGVGTVQFGLDYGVSNQTGKVLRDEVENILSECRKSGINLLDTAIAYGSSEQVLGGVGVEEFRVVTKLPPLHADQFDIPRWIREQVDASLRRLRIKRLYGLLLHNPLDLLGLRGAQLIKALMHIKDDGAVEKIGISIYDPDELHSVYEKLKIDLVQAPLNVVDRRLQLSGWLDRMKADGVEIHSRSVFLQGLLLMKREELSTQFSGWSNLWDMWGKKLGDLGTSPLAACLAYPLSLEQVDQVIVGVQNANQLREIVATANSVNFSFNTSFMISNDVHLLNPSNWKNL